MTRRIIKKICEAGPIGLDDLAQRLSANVPEDQKEWKRNQIKKAASRLQKKGILRQDKRERLSINPAKINLNRA
ncbi:MAG TPA: hypothetical protein VFA52_03760 [Candidatus Paceibacterota bacterium]|nr:hypothetical protein [Candidatus Paceibacterota bacterium]